MNAIINKEKRKWINEVPNKYLKQMSIYKSMLIEAYPDKKIECFLIWTSIPEIMALPNELLEMIL